MEEVIRAPAPVGLLGEARGFLEFPKLIARFPILASQPKGDGQRVLVLPGYRPLETPVTAVYSRSDAVVAWKACMDRHGKNVEHVEVESTHPGLGFSPDVYQIIAKRLAREERS